MKKQMFSSCVRVKTHGTDGQQSCRPHGRRQHMKHVFTSASFYVHTSVFTKRDARTVRKKISIGYIDTHIVDFLVSRHTSVHHVASLLCKTRRAVQASDCGCCHFPYVWVNLEAVFQLTLHWIKSCKGALSWVEGGGSMPFVNTKYTKKKKKKVPLSWWKCFGTKKKTKKIENSFIYGQTKQLRTPDSSCLCASSKTPTAQTFIFHHQNWLESKGRPKISCAGF